MTESSNYATCLAKGRYIVKLLKKNNSAGRASAAIQARIWHTESPS